MTTAPAPELLLDHRRRFHSRLIGRYLPLRVVARPLERAKPHAPRFAVDHELPVRGVGFEHRRRIGRRVLARCRGFPPRHGQFIAEPLDLRVFVRVLRLGGDKIALQRLDAVFWRLRGLVAGQ